MGASYHLFGAEAVLMIVRDEKRCVPNLRETMLFIVLGILVVPENGVRAARCSPDSCGPASS